MDPLTVENVEKHYRQGDQTVRALAGVTLGVPEGRFMAIMGASGSGKSTLLHLMAGLTTADAGTVRVVGTDLARLGDRKLTLFRRRQIGLVFQSFNLIPTLTLEENVSLPLMLDGRLDRAAKARVRDLIDTLGLAKRAGHRPDAMSGGEQQRCAIGRALATDPAVVLADEPTGNLDTANSQAVCDLLRSLCRQTGKTIVMVTHEPSVAAYADEVAVLRDGLLLDRFETAPLTGGGALAARYQELVAGV